MKTIRLFFGLTILFAAIFLRNGAAQVTSKSLSLSDLASISLASETALQSGRYTYEGNIEIFNQESTTGAPPSQASTVKGAFAFKGTKLLYKRTETQGSNEGYDETWAYNGSTTTNFSERNKGASLRKGDDVIRPMPNIFRESRGYLRGAIPLSEYFKLVEGNIRHGDKTTMSLTLTKTDERELLTLVFGGWTLKMDPEANYFPVYQCWRDRKGTVLVEAAYSPSQAVRRPVVSAGS